MTFRSIADISGTKRDPRVFIPNDEFPLPRTKIGIEVEMENPHTGALQAVLNSGRWQSHRDNSLRNNGIEVVTHPVFGDDILIALDVLQNNMAVHPPTFNERCSVHIHMEVVDLQKEDLIKLLLLYTAVERLLLNYVQPHRKINAYCLPYYLSTDYKRLLYDVFKVLRADVVDDARNYIDRWPKYSALNLRRILDIGTIEFRQLHGTVNKQEILTWIKLLMCLKKFAQEMTALDDFPEFVSSFHVEEYLRTIFGDLYHHVLTPTAEHDLMLGVRYAQDVLCIQGIYGLQDALYTKEYKTNSFSTMYPSKKKEQASDNIVPNIPIETWHGPEVRETVQNVIHRMREAAQTGAQVPPPTPRPRTRSTTLPLTNTDFTTWPASPPEGNTQTLQGFLRTPATHANPEDLEF